MIGSEINSMKKGSFRFLMKYQRIWRKKKKKREKEKLMEWENKINIFSSSTKLYCLQETAVDFISKLFVITYCHSIAGKFLNLVKMHLKSAFMAFEITALIIDQTLQHGIHKCNTLITVGISDGVEKKAQICLSLSFARNRWCLPNYCKL